MVYTWVRARVCVYVCAYLGVFMCHCGTVGSVLFCYYVYIYVCAYCEECVIDCICGICSIYKCYCVVLRVCYM